jgi:5,10-methylenetetrahydromethanopterin reductase
MRIGIFTGDVGAGDVDGYVDAAGTARDEGFSSYWVSQIFGHDALTLLAVIGREVPDIELGTAVVPTYPRHPMVLAGQALTTNAAASGRLVLGIGLSHQIVIEGMWGYSFDKPARHMREYLSALMPLIRGEGISVEGETLTARGQVTVPGSSPMPVVLAALAPRMLELAGSVADGTLTWCTGPATLESHVIPSINAAADKAGRDTPRVIAGLPVCVTDDKDAARERIAKALAIYPTLPSYKAMLDKEGVANPADIGLIGSQDEVLAGIERLQKVGVTDFAASEMPGNDDERARTRAALVAALT